MSPERLYLESRKRMSVYELIDEIKARPDVADTLVGPSVAGAAAILGVSRQRVYQLVEQGRLVLVEVWTHGREGDFLIDGDPEPRYDYNIDQLEDGTVYVAVTEDDEHIASAMEGQPGGPNLVGSMVSRESIQRFQATDRKPGRPRSNEDA